MSLNGILIVDKPGGWTSHDVIAKLRGALGQKRIGHGGTLDPMATGVLPVFAGRATRAAQFSENAEKEYIAGLRLGIVTDTQDVTGSVIAESKASATPDELNEILQRFKGAQKQVPPMYSAIKKDGKKLYELARRGVDVPRAARDVYISAIDLLGGGGDDYSLRVVCSKGTYIRTLCHDIGAALGCGGTLSSLRRTRAGAFEIGAAHTLDDILAAVSSGEVEKIAMPVDSLFYEYPAATLSHEEARKCKNGSPCRAEDLGDGRYRFYGPDDEFLMLADVFERQAIAVKRFHSPP